MYTVTVDFFFTLSDLNSSLTILKKHFTNAQKDLCVAVNLYEYLSVCA